MALKHRRAKAAPRLERLETRTLLSLDGWQGYALDPQHTALSPVASAGLGLIHWQTPVDLAPQYSGGDLLIHYGSPLVTASNTVLVPVKTGASGGFEIQSTLWGHGCLTVDLDHRLRPSAVGRPERLQLDAELLSHAHTDEPARSRRQWRHGSLHQFTRRLRAVTPDHHSDRLLRHFQLQRQPLRLQYHGLHQHADHH